MWIANHGPTIDLNRIVLVFLIVYCMNRQAIPSFSETLANNAGRVLTICIVFSFIFCFTKAFLAHQIHVLPETIMRVSWYVWAFLTAYLCHGRLFAESTFPVALRLPGLCVLLFILFNCIQRCDLTRLVFEGFRAGGLLLILFAFFSGGFVTLDKLKSEPQVDMKVLGVSGFGYAMVFLFFSCTYFYLLAKSRRERLLNLALLVLTFTMVIWPASRKAFLGVIAFICLCLIFCLPELGKKQKAILYCALPIVFLAILFLARPAVSDIYLARRFTEGIEHERTAERFDERFSGRGRFYTQALEIIPSYPVFGIGTGAFKSEFEIKGYSAHSDYVQIFCETGIPGGLLYFSMYFIILIRISKVKKKVRDPATFKTLGVMQSAIITILLVSLGRGNSYEPLTTIMIAIAGEFSWRVQLAIERPYCYERSIGNPRWSTATMF